MTAACWSWFARDFLVRDALRAGAVIAGTQARMPDGRLVDLPEPCGHDPLDCPPVPRAASLPLAAVVVFPSPVEPIGEAA